MNTFTQTPPRIQQLLNATMVVDVQARMVSNGTRTVWDIYTPDGTKWTTFSAEVGNKAFPLKGQLADLQVSISQKGDFTNYNLDDIRPAHGAVQGSLPLSEVVQAAQQARSSQPQPEVSYGQYKSLEGDKTLSIHRQVAAKVAGQIVASVGGSTAEDFWQNIEALVKFFQTGNTPFAQREADPADKVFVTPGQPVHQQAPVTTSQPESDAYAHTDNDIPF